MKILVTGATGLVGYKLCKKLLFLGHDLVVIGRENEKNFKLRFTLPCEYFPWENLDNSTLPKVDGVIHLAGDPLAEGRWTREKKEKILNSRIDTTTKLVDYFIKNNIFPGYFISASAIGFYGSKESHVLTEDCPQGNDFLADVCFQWEKASQKIKDHTRLINLRIGVVLDNQEGFLKPMQKLFSLGLGAKVGKGNQYLSWIHIEDLINQIIYLTENKNAFGAYNAVAPNPVTNSEFTDLYSKQLNVNKFLPAPASILKLILGEKSQLALMSQNVSSKKIESLGFKFKYTNLTAALSDLYQWQSNSREVLFKVDQWIPLQQSEVFPFFSDAKNLELITPPWLNFKILKISSREIKTGTLIDYSLKLHGFPINWRTEILNWEPNSKFSDTQLKGPYKKWHHTHYFESLKNGTLMTDEIIYQLPLGKMGSLAAGGLVASDVKKIFKYRKKIILDKWG